MHCLITSGPTFESLDNVRRLTNFSSGRLGTELANHLTQHGHTVTLLRGEGSTWSGPVLPTRRVPFTDTASLLERFKGLATQTPPVEAIFHAAAVSDFKFGKVWEKDAQGACVEIRSGKLSTRQGTLLAELVPTPKIIAELRGLFPKAWIVGWKFEVDGTRPDVLSKARDQMRENRTDACVVNGKAYGPGFGVLRADGDLEHRHTAAELFQSLAARLE